MNNPNLKKNLNLVLIMNKKLKIVWKNLNKMKLKSLKKLKI